MGKNLLELKSLDVSEIVSILDQAQAFHDGEVFRGLEGRIAANLFYSFRNIDILQGDAALKDLIVDL